MTYNDIYTLDVSGSTVVMNGCASAAAKGVSGAGVMGLTIPDHTCVLFESFHSNWKQNCDKGPRWTVIDYSRRNSRSCGPTLGGPTRNRSAFYMVGKD